jgi:hypothetical protein
MQVYIHSWSNYICSLGGALTLEGEIYIWNQRGELASQSLLLDLAIRELDNELMTKQPTQDRGLGIVITGEIYIYKGSLHFMYPTRLFTVHLSWSYFAERARDLACNSISTSSNLSCLLVVSLECRFQSYRREEANTREVAQICRWVSAVFTRDTSRRRGNSSCRWSDESCHWYIVGDPSSYRRESFVDSNDTF